MSTGTPIRTDVEPTADAHYGTEHGNDAGANASNKMSTHTGNSAEPAADVADADLAMVVAAWAKLPSGYKAGILALVRAAGLHGGAVTTASDEAPERRGA